MKLNNVRCFNKAVTAVIVVGLVALAVVLYLRHSNRWSDLFGSKNAGEDLFPVPAGDKWGYINYEGKFVIQPIYADANSFNEGRAVVSLKSGEEYTSAMIDKTGRVLFSTPGGIGMFSDGLASVHQDGQCGYIDKGGNIVIELKYSTCYYFSEGLARVSTQEGSWSFIDRKGDIVIPMAYRDPSENSDAELAVFSDGMLSVSFDSDTPDLPPLIGPIVRSGNLQAHSQF